MLLVTRLEVRAIVTNNTKAHENINALGTYKLQILPKTNYADITRY